LVFFECRQQLFEICKRIHSISTNELFRFTANLLAYFHSFPHSKHFLLGVRKMKHPNSIKGMKHVKKDNSIIIPKITPECG
jgi:hypothetical protein